MHLLKCEQGHIYDTDKFRSCPHCSKIDIDIEVADTFGEDQADVETEIPEGERLEEYEQIGIRKTVGMLVCVEGQMKGAGFILREGENDIGRASNMDIALVREVTISRKSSASIWYNEKGEYVFRVLESKGEFFCNGKLVKSECILKDRDELELGECKLILIEAGNVWK